MYLNFWQIQTTTVRNKWLGPRIVSSYKFFFTHQIILSEQILELKQHYFNGFFWLFFSERFISNKYISGISFQCFDRMFNVLKFLVYYNFHIIKAVTSYRQRFLKTTGKYYAYITNFLFNFSDKACRIHEQNISLCLFCY